MQPSIPAIGAFGGGPLAEHTFFEALIEPSLQTNVAPSQWEMPPLRPEHGVLAANNGMLTNRDATKAISWKRISLISYPLFAEK